MRLPSGEIVSVCFSSQACRVRKALRLSRVPERTFYRWRAIDPWFESAYQALDSGLVKDRLEDWAWERAKRGDLEVEHSERWGKRTVRRLLTARTHEASPLRDAHECMLS